MKLAFGAALLLLAAPALAQERCPSKPTSCPVRPPREDLLFNAICLQGYTEDPIDRCSGVKEGLLLCACCGQPLFEAKHKCESDSGWPSFTQAIPGAVCDTPLETVCNNCGAHLGDFFDYPFNEKDECFLNGVSSRYCINGICLTPTQEGTNCDYPYGNITEFLLASERV